MKTTKQLFEDLEQDALSIIGCSTSLLDAIKTRDKEIEARDKEIEELKLQLQTINHPLKK